MRIGLVGVPGCGKTVLANSLKLALESTEKEELLPVAVVDEYVEELSKEIDLALGWFGTYIGNFHVALKRDTCERLALKDHSTVITCGTIFETSSYTAQHMQGEYELTVADDRDARSSIMIQVEAITRMLACLYADTVRYDHIFYLPPVGEIQDVRIKELEKNLQAAFNGFNLYPVTKLFVDGDNLLEITENRLKIVLEEVLNEDNAKG